MVPPPGHTKAGRRVHVSAHGLGSSPPEGWGLEKTHDEDYSTGAVENRSYHPVSEQGPRYGDKACVLYVLYVLYV